MQKMFYLNVVEREYELCHKTIKLRLHHSRSFAHYCGQRSSLLWTSTL